MAGDKPFLILQQRPEDETSDDEFAAILRYGGLDHQSVHRVRMEKEGVPPINLDNYSAVLMGGGPYNVSDDEKTKPPEQKKFEIELQPLMTQMIERDFPFLGACSGISQLSKHLGGTISKERYAETVKATTITLTEEGIVDPLLKGLPRSFRAFGGHKESCQDVAPNAVLLASSEICPFHIIRVRNNLYATQFHTELDKEGLALRIRFYKNLGYFPPEDAEKLIEASEKEIITVPGTILSRFVSKYQV